MKRQPPKPEPENPVAKRTRLIDHVLCVVNLALNNPKQDDEVRDEAIEIKKLLKQRKGELAKAA